MAWDDSSRDTRPAVLISHAWAGRGELEEHRAEQLAELGYVGFALDMYGKGKRGASKEENDAFTDEIIARVPEKAAEIESGNGRGA